ncbi:CHAT domain-containing protein [Pseudanabaena sp. ABRG5-3]|uniref:CHAT domain-containing protein n=1 Tax=Pseudanabaena sp. ABRG5-3 TaxID=685565 RepID=UPI000DC6FF7D|nr:CHAT domain-containing protein [Pseudanabaena sp. ABRG5-3]BBC24385.1 tetratricopeptide [Pseudanabaena sp. ABRG5-3]
MLQKISIQVFMQGKLIRDRLSITAIVGMLLIGGEMFGEVGINPVYALKVLDSDQHQLIAAEPSMETSADNTSKSIDLLIPKAEKLFDQGRFQESLKQYQQVLNLYRQQSDRLGESIALTGLGMVQVSLRQETQAIANLQQALTILQSPSSSLATTDKLRYRQAEGETRYQLGRAYLNLEQYAKALPLLEQSLAIRKEVGDRYREGKTLATIGVIYVKKYEFPKSVAYFEDGLKLSRAEGNRAAEGQILFYLASIYSLLGQKDQALALAQQSYAAYQALGNPLGQANALNLEGNIFSLSFEYKKVVQLNLKALELVRQAGDRPLEAEILNAVATSYRNLSEYPQAIEFYGQAQKVYQELGDRAGEGRNLKNIAEVRLAQSQNREALALYEQAKDIYQSLTNVPNVKPSDRQTLASILIGEGSLYTALSQFPKALSALQDARSIYQAIGDTQGEGVASMYLATLYIQLGETAKIDEILKRLPALTKNSPQLQEMAKELVAQFNALSSSASRNPQARLQSALSLLEFFKQSGNRTSEAAMLAQVGYIYSELKQTAQAIAYQKQALDIYRAIGDRAGIGNTFYNIGLIYALSQQSDKAFMAFQEALSLAREVGNRNQESKMFGNIGSLLQNQYPELAIAFYKQSVNGIEAIRKELRVLSLDEQKSYQKTIAYNYRILADLLLQQGRVMEALQVLDLLKVQELQDYLQNVKGNERTAQGIYVFPEEAAQIQAIAKQRLTSLQPFIDSNQKIVNQLSQIPPTELNRVPAYLQNLPQDHALLYPLILGDRLELILFIPNKPPIHRSVKIKEAEIIQLVQAFKAGLRDTTSLDVIEPATKLYNILIKPIEAELAQTKTIFYAPDGQLRYVPIAALYDGKQWLVEKYSINNLIAYSLSDFTPKPPKPLQTFAGAFGGAPNTTKFGQVGLPATVDEVQAISSALPNTVKLVANDFSRKATEAQMQTKNLIHLATHAEFNAGKPENSFLIFGNGDRILLNEMKDLPMSNVDLIVLSACQTGVGNLGNGIEILGFGYQVQRAGAKAAIASLWQVSDEGTQALMQSFYSNIKQSDQSKANSLRQAQLATIRSKDFSHPYFWSAFILISNGL